MSNQSDYNEKLKIISNIPDERVIKPNMPIYVANQEAEDLARHAARDSQVLLKAGLPPGLIEDLAKRAGACRHAQALWIQKRFLHKQARKEWKEKSARSHLFHKKLLHQFKYAYRNHPNLRNVVVEIARKKSHADMFQDLNDLAVLGKAHPQPLKNIGFDLTLLEKSARLSDELAELYARYNAERMSNKPARVIRDKAYTHMKMAMDEIRECGRYVFWHNKEKLKEYRSNYHRHQSARRKKDEDGNGEEQHIRPINRNIPG